MNKLKIIFFILLIGIFIAGCINLGDEIDYDDEVSNAMGTRAGLATVITYPTVSEIASNYQVVASMTAAWNSTIDAARRGYRQEYGFFIYYDYIKNDIKPGSIVMGGAITGCAGTNASINLGIPTSNLQVCGFFHTHTPLNNCSQGDSRVVGPSGTDTRAYNGTLPGLLYDFVGTNGVIIGGHSLSAPKKLYTFGPNRKASINI